MLFEKYKIKQYIVKNRIVMAPMCMYQSDNCGFVKEFHKAHYYSRSLGGVGIVIVEATSVSENGRISVRDLGIWREEHVDGLSQLASNIREAGAIPFIQLNHAGRKSFSKKVIAPSSISNYRSDKLLEKMTTKIIDEVIDDFVKAAIRADKAGFDGIEIHAAHGYLISQFMSPISNKRKDEYSNKHLFLKRVVESIQKVWPKKKLMSIRVSATEYHPDGFTIKDVIDILNKIDLKNVDYINVSSGGNIPPKKIKLKTGYQLEFSKKIKSALNVHVIGGGLISNYNSANRALKRNKCDSIFFGRLLLRDPMYFLRIEKGLDWPQAYKRGK